jgi:hypothetical protein
MRSLTRRFDNFLKKDIFTISTFSDPNFELNITPYNLKEAVTLREHVQEFREMMVLQDWKRCRDEMNAMVNCENEILQLLHKKDALQIIPAIRELIKNTENTDAQPHSDKKPTIVPTGQRPKSEEDFDLFGRPSRSTNRQLDP